MIRAPEIYDAENERRHRDDLETQIKELQQKLRQPMIVSPNGTVFRLLVADDGTLSTTPA